MAAGEDGDDWSRESCTEGILPWRMTRCGAAILEFDAAAMKRMEEVRRPEKVAHRTAEWWRAHSDVSEAPEGTMESGVACSKTVAAR